MTTDKQEIIKSVFRRKILPMLINLHGSVPNNLEATIIEKSRVSTVVKEQFIAESGDTEEGHLIYFESGIARCYYYDTAADKQINTRIAKKDDVLIDINAYLYGSKQSEYIQMLESGTLITFSYTNLKLLLAEFQSMYLIFLYFLAEKEKQHAAYQRLLKSNADERVKIFLEDHPGIAARISNEHVANYLDMNRTTFSSAYAKYKSEKDKNS
jgi:CRP-like cAMP-binding protein